MLIFCDRHFVSWETILAARLAFAFLLAMHSFKKSTYYLLFFLHQGTSKGLRFTTSISCSLCTDVRCVNFIIWVCDDSSVLKILPCWRLCRIYTRWLCRIEDSAVWSTSTFYAAFSVRVSKTRVEMIIRWNDLKQTASVLTDWIQTWSNFSSKRKRIK